MDRPRPGVASVVWIALLRLRGRWLSLVPIMLVMAVLGGGAVVALEVAWRTERAYPRYVHDADVGQVEINPSLYTAEIDEAIRSLPGIARVTTSDLYLAWPGYEGPPMRYSEASAASSELANIGVTGSVDGRFLTMDRLAYVAGRSADGPAEAVVDRNAADTLGLEIGDRLPISFWDVRAELAAFYGVGDPMMERVGIEHLEVVGIATFPRKVLGDDLYQTGFIVVSPDVARRYTCDPIEPPPGFVTEHGITETIPPGCVTSYRYWSALVDGGTTGAAGVQEAFVRAASDRNAALPADFRAAARYLLITSTIDGHLQNVERAVQPTVTALRVVGAVAAILTVTVVGVMSLRSLRRWSDDRQAWRQLGASRGLTAVVEALPMVVAVSVGLVAATATAWLGSRAGPVGAVRIVAPEIRALEVESIVALVLLWAVTVLLVGVLAWRASGWWRRVEPQRSTLVSRTLAAAAARPAVAQGLGGALSRPRGAGLTAVLGTISVATLVAALTFGASLDRLLATPAWYGWPWDAGAMIGAGYSSGVTVDDVGERFDDLDDVESWTGLGFWQSVLVDGTTVPTMVAFGEPSGLDLTVLDGRLPSHASEVALGAAFARSRGIAVGDAVPIAGELMTVDEVTVTGLLVFPSLGPLESDHLTPDHGVLIREDALETDETPYQLLTFLGVRTPPGADRQALLSAIEPDLHRWDSNGSVRTLDEPLRPAPISSVGDVRTVPMAIALATALAASLGLATAVYAAVRSRDRDVGVLRSLGFTRGLVRRMVAVQSLVTVGVSLAAGVPLGIVVGRAAWRGYAERIGVIADPTVSVVLIGVVVLGGLAVALMAAVLPARRASQATPAELLRG